MPVRVAAASIRHGLSRNPEPSQGIIFESTALSSMMAT